MGFLSFLLCEGLSQKNTPPIETSAPKEVVKTKKNKFPPDEIMQYDGEVLDVESPENVERFKHNLQVLIARAKQKKRIDKLYLIRQDDFFPKNWEWNVLSDQTCLDLVTTSLSFEVRQAYALEQAGIQPYITFDDIIIPNNSAEEKAALSNIDKTFGAVFLPSYFRSTKHFTVNTSLGVTGDYNTVRDNRNFIVFDSIDNFLNSGYAYSIAGHDAYLDVSHEPLKISDQGFVMISDEKYDAIMKDPEIKAELLQKKVIRFKGDESIAINMVLAAYGALPTQVGFAYATYDDELREIYEKSFKDLADENGLMYDQSHGGNGGHFSYWYDKKNRDRDKACSEFLEFLRETFPENEHLFSNSTVFGPNNSAKIVCKIGAQNILDAINKYNAETKLRMAKKFETYRQERESITPEEHRIFVATIQAINNFYITTKVNIGCDLEEKIQQFFQGKSKQDQLTCAVQILDMVQLAHQPNKSAETGLPLMRFANVDNLQGFPFCNKDLTYSRE